MSFAFVFLHMLRARQLWYETVTSFRSNRDEAYDLVVARMSSYLLHRLCASFAFVHMQPFLQSRCATKFNRQHNVDRARQKPPDSKSILGQDRIPMLLAAAFGPKSPQDKNLDHLGKTTLSGSGFLTGFFGALQQDILHENSTSPSSLGLHS